MWERSHVLYFRLFELYLKEEDTTKKPLGGAEDEASGDKNGRLYDKVRAALPIF